MSEFIIKSNKAIARGVYEMKLCGDTAGCTPGRFVNIRIESFYLRRPISVCDVNGEELTLIYKVVGGGTDAMSKMQTGKSLDLLVGLGNGYDISKSGKHPLLVAGGVGVPPMYYLAKKLLAGGYSPVMLMGFNTADDVFYKAEFESLCPTHVTTADGSVGVRGLVTDAMTDIFYDYIFTCGPEPMLKAVYRASDADGQYSFEERMGCGFGACMGCTCRTKYGSKRICKDGPVLQKEEIIW